MPTLKPTPRLDPTFPRTISRVFPNPEGMEWDEWVEMAVGLNGRLGLPRLVGPMEDWREFSDRLALFVPDTPVHDDYDDWREWVLALRSALAL